MPRTAQSVISRALQISKTGNLTNSATLLGYTVQALDELNAILDHIAATIDFGKATRSYQFALNPNLVTSGQGNIVQAASNPLPIDYLRVQTAGGTTGAQRSTKWYLDGVPYDLIEIDLTEWDDQVQQAGIQSYPYFAAKEMSLGAVLLNFVGDLNAASTTVANVSTVSPLTGVITAGIPAGLAVGMSIAGGIGNLNPIVPGTTITQINAGPGTIVLSQAPNYLDASPGNYGTFTGTLAGASLMAGYPANLLVYPPPSGAFSALIRYQCRMPPLTQTQVNNGAYCWFEDDTVLVRWLSAALGNYSDDQRVQSFEQATQFYLGKYTKNADDRNNRAQRVELDRRAFGRKFSTLAQTKTVGWTILLFCATSFLHMLIGNAMP